MKNSSLLFILFVFALSIEPVQAGPPRGTVGDLWADRIIGQFDYSEEKPGDAIAQGLFNPTSSYVDPAYDRLYIVDSGNNRILGITHISTAITSSLVPDIVLGQASMTATGANGDSNWQTYDVTLASPRYDSPLILPNAVNLMGEPFWNQSPLEGGAADNLQGDTLGNIYVPDLYNNRVIRYDAASITSNPYGPTASDVWGQPDMNSFAYNDIGGNVQGAAPSASSLGFCGLLSSTPDQACGLAIDPWGNLWVADISNNRVLRFPNSSGVAGAHPSHTADVVFGQNSFTTATYAGNYTTSDLTDIIFPTAVRVDNAGNVYVLECYPGTFNCIAIFKPTTPPSGSTPPQYQATGQSAVTVFNAYTIPGGSATNLSTPLGLEIDTTTSSPSVPSPAMTTVGLWVEDRDTSDSVNFQINWSPTFSYTVPRVVAHGYNCRGSVGVSNNGALYINNYEAGIPSNSRYPNPPAGVSNTYDIQPIPNPNGQFPNKVDGVGFLVPSGMAIAKSASVTQLIVGDISTIRYWNLPSGSPVGLTNGQTASGEAGGTTPLYQINSANYGRMTVDNSGHLYVLHTNLSLSYQGLNVSQIEKYNLPLTQGASPTNILTGPISVLGQGVSVNWGPLDGIAVDTNGSLWVSDFYSNRALRIRGPFSGNPVVDVVIGQTQPAFGSPVGGGCNQTGQNFYTQNPPCTNTSPTANSLNGGCALKLDNHGDLFIPDTFLEANGNWRMLRYSANLLPSNTTTVCAFNIAADAVFGTNGSFTTYDYGQDGGNTAYWEPAFTSDDSYMVVGMNSQISGDYPPVIISNPRQIIASPSSTNNWDNNVVGHLKDFGPQSVALTFDDQNNLYVLELNRNRVMVYLQPIAVAIPTSTSTVTSSPTQTATCTTTQTASPSQTSTLVNTATVTQTVTPTMTQTVTGTMTATSTITSSPTMTYTFTASPTNTPETDICALYPNPVSTDNQVSICYSVTGPSTLKWSVFTLAFRKIYEGTSEVTSPGSVTWNLKDKEGVPVANGLYYVRITISGAHSARSIQKLLVLH